MTDDPLVETKNIRKKVGPTYIIFVFLCVASVALSIISIFFMSYPEDQYHYRFYFITLSYSIVMFVVTVYIFTKIERNRAEIFLLKEKLKDADDTINNILKEKEYMSKGEILPDYIT